uniref:alpha/beta fold hydrolase n=1 Tax=Pseudomonas viridiflava TaxID=33069 RepID=UPI003C76203F
QLLQWVDDTAEMIWGDQDALLGIEQAAAWSAILARADLTISLKPGWGHYPWIDSPAEFAQWLESGERGFIAHTKGGRLRLAASAGQPVPTALSVVQGDEVDVSG